MKLILLVVMLMSFLSCASTTEKTQIKKNKDIYGHLVR